MTYIMNLLDISIVLSTILFLVGLLFEFIFPYYLSYFGLSIYFFLVNYFPSRNHLVFYYSIFYTFPLILTNLYYIKNRKTLEMARSIVHFSYFGVLVFITFIVINNLTNLIDNLLMMVRFISSVILAVMIIFGIVTIIRIPKDQTFKSIKLWVSIQILYWIIQPFLFSYLPFVIFEGNYSAGISLANSINNLIMLVNIHYLRKFAQQEIFI